jgi:flavin-dependent dehydrogenase
MFSADVIVIGAGPAGVAAAITCVKAGLKVTLLNDNPEAFGDAASGQMEPLQSLHPGAESLLRQLGLGGVIAYASKGNYTGIQTGENVAPLSTAEGETWVGHHIAPSLFTEYALLKAKEFGADVHFNSRVNELICADDAITGVILSNGTQLACKYLVDASGRNRFVGRYLKFDEEVFSRPLLSWTGIGAIGPNETRNTQLAHFEPEPHGWTWTAFGNNGHYTFTKLLANKTQSIAFPSHLATSFKNAPIKAASMQWRVFRPLVCPGLLLAGDAAGVLDPAAGQGILSGLMSGIMAGETVTSCLNDMHLANWHLSRYDSWFMAHFNHKKDILAKRYQEMGIDIAPQN